MHFWSNLALICGLVFIASLNETMGRVIPAELEDAFKKLETQLKLMDTEWMGKAVFSPYLGKVESTCTCEKMMLMSMLNVYMDIFTEMKSKSKVYEKQLNVLQSKVTCLRDEGFSKEKIALKYIQDIASTDVKNSTVQGGALSDFKSVFKMAHSTGDHSKKLKCMSTH